MNKFWELFRESVILQAMITLVLILVLVYMMVSGKEIPDQLYQMTFLVLGFYFGGKIENGKARAIQQMQDNKDGE